MGFGDEVLVTGEVKHLQKQLQTPRKVMVTDRHGRPRWHPLWEGNPRIARPGEEGPHLLLANAPNTRPYIDWARMARDFAAVYPGKPFTTKGIRDRRLPWRFTDHRCKRGELYTNRLPPGGYIVVEPHYKAGVSPNRDWGFARWQTVVDAVKADWWQINGPGALILSGVRHVPAESFLRACELLSGARLYVGPEGGLYHAAAALGIPSVAIFGGFVSPANQGYDDCANLYEPMDGVSPCGQRVRCAHCAKAMARITLENVTDAVRRALDA